MFVKCVCVCVRARALCVDTHFHIPPKYKYYWGPICVCLYFDMYVKDVLSFTCVMHFYVNIFHPPSLCACTLVCVHACTRNKCVLCVTMLVYLSVCVCAVVYIGFYAQFYINTF